MGVDQGSRYKVPHISVKRCTGTEAPDVGHEVAAKRYWNSQLYGVFVSATAVISGVDI